jgi:hypothetical protein
MLGAIVFASLFFKLLVCKSFHFCWSSLLGDQRTPHEQQILAYTHLILYADFKSTIDLELVFDYQKIIFTDIK